jgi:hypothetical protein
MKIAVKNLIVTGAVVSATLLSLVAVNKPANAKGLEMFTNNPINTEYNSNCHGGDSEDHEDHQSSSSKS